MNKLIIVITLVSFNLFAIASEKTKTFVYQAEMSCNHCANSIKTVLKQVRKVKSYKADPEKDLIWIEFSDKQEPLSDKEIKKITFDAGYELKLKK